MGQPTAPRRARVPPLVRLLAALSVLTLAGTYVAAQVDFVRRHEPGIDPIRYWLPQLTNIWLPGLGAALVFAGLAFALHMRVRAE
jgi:hypothetical protein